MAHPALQAACAAPTISAQCQTAVQRTRRSSAATRHAAAAPPPPARTCGAAGSRRWRRLVARAAEGSGSGAAEPEADGDEAGGLEEMQRQFQLAAARAEALEEYRLLMAEPDASLGAQLLRAAWLIARHRRPLVRYEDLVDQLDDLAVQVEGRLPAGAVPLKVLTTLSDQLYNERGFRGNTESYYDPDNSCIDAVLARRTGIPISLSLVYMEVARRVGLDLVGVNLPGHFFIAPADPELEFLVDAFNGGEVSFQQDVEATLARVYGREVRLDPALLARRAPLPPRTFLARWLTNLKQVYTARRDFAAALQVSRYLQATRPGDADELRDAGVLLYHLGRFPECKEALTEYLARAPGNSEDARRVRALLASLDQQQRGPDG